MACLSGAAAGAIVGVVVDAAATVAGVHSAAGAQTRDYEALSKEIYAELIAFRSTADMPENVKAAAEAIQRRLVDAGFAAEDEPACEPTPMILIAPSATSCVIESRSASWVETCPSLRGPRRSTLPRDKVMRRKREV